MKRGDEVSSLCPTYKAIMEVVIEKTRIKLKNEERKSLEASHAKQLEVVKGQKKDLMEDSYYSPIIWRRNE